MRAFLLLMTLLAAGCAGGAQQPAEQGADAGGARNRACLDAIRDARTWCTGGTGGSPAFDSAGGVLRETDPAGSYNCLDARLRIDRLCYPEQSREQQ